MPFCVSLCTRQIRIVRGMLLIAGCFASYSSGACTAQSVEVPEVRMVVQENGGYPLSDAQCGLLNSNGLKLRVVGQTAIFYGSVVAWANVVLQDQATGIVSTEAGMSTFANSMHRDQQFANKLLFDAVSDAISQLKFDAAVKDINSFRANLSTNLRKR